MPNLSCLAVCKVMLVVDTAVVVVEADSGFDDFDDVVVGTGVAVVEDDLVVIAVVGKGIAAAVVVVAVVAVVEVVVGECLESTVGIASTDHYQIDSVYQ